METWHFMAIPVDNGKIIRIGLSYPLIEQAPTAIVLRSSTKTFPKSKSIPDTASIVDTVSGKNIKEPVFRGRPDSPETRTTLIRPAVKAAVLSLFLKPAIIPVYR